jgi:LysR family transcriptional regulator for metE and metH
VRDIPKLPRPSLEVRDLQLVLALAAAGSTARAASVLHLTQPAVSRALLALEDKLKTALFERSAKGLVPSSAGERLLAGARELLVALQALEQRTCTAQPAVKLRLVCECYTAYHWLPSVLSSLSQTAPTLEVTLEVAHTHAPVAALEAGDVDVALLTTGRLIGVGIRERPLFDDEVVFLLAASHPLAKKKSLTRTDLERTPILTSSNTPAAERAWFLRSVFGRKRPKLTFQGLPLSEAILDVARAGMGIAVMSEWIAAPHLARGELVARRLSTGALRRPWRIAYRRDAEEALKWLEPLLRSAAPKLRLAV